MVLNELENVRYVKFSRLMLNTGSFKQFTGGELVGVVPCCPLD